MTEQGKEFSGKTVEEAIAEGLRVLGAAHADVTVEIINKGSRGILGFGSEPAVVRLSPRTQPDAPQASGASTPPTEAPPARSPSVVVEPSSGKDTPSTPASSISPPQNLRSEQDAGPDRTSGTDDVGTDDASQDDAGPGDAITDDEGSNEDGAEIDGTEIDGTEIDGTEIDDANLAEMATSLLTQLVHLMGFEAVIEAEWQEADETTTSPYLLLNIRGDDLGALIGRRGETLSSLQYLLRLMVNQQVRQWKNIVVDVEQYKQRRVTQLAQLADRMARQVAETGRSVTLEPMPGNERRIVHMTLRDHPDVFTESTGDGERRKVNIFPRH